MKNWFLIILVLPLVVFSCRKDTDIITTTNSGYEPPIVLVTADLAGQIVDPGGTAVEGAIVRVGSHVTTSNTEGLYQFQNIQMNAKGTYVTVSKNGYFHGSDRLYPANGSRNVNTIELLPRTLAATITGSQGGTVDVNGASIELPANAVVNMQGSVVNGDVQVYAQWLNPAADNLGDFMPGGLFGLNKDGQEVTMTSMGMLAVELTDAAGNELQIAGGTAATLTFPVPAELRSIAPATIPLWHFDETDGIWIEEGAATFDGSVYVGDVSHFTFWNVDFPYGTETVEINGCIKYDDGSAAAFQQFTVRVEGGGTIIWGTTDDLGHFYGPVPVNEVLVFRVNDACGGVQTFSVGPFSENTDIVGCFILPGEDAVTLSGQLVDCDGAGVSEGVIMLNYYWPAQIVTTDEDGNFSHTFSGCATHTFTLTGYDFANNEATDTEEYTISEDLDIGTLAACDNPLESYIDSDANGYLLSFFDINLAVDTFTISPDSIVFNEYSAITSRGFDFATGDVSDIAIYLNDLSVGSYTGDDVAYSYYYSGQMNEGFSLNCWIPCNSITVNITLNEGPGGFLEGNYSGTSNGWDNMQQQIVDGPVSGTFRVRIPN